MLGPATDEEVRAAQILSGAMMAAWLACGLIPGLRRFATWIRMGLLGSYLCAGGVFIAYMLLR